MDSFGESDVEDTKQKNDKFHQNSNDEDSSTDESCGNADMS